MSPVSYHYSKSALSDFLDNDFLPTFGENESWEPSGKRVHRGQYKTAHGILINADSTEQQTFLESSDTARH